MTRPNQGHLFRFRFLYLCICAAVLFSLSMGTAAQAGDSPAALEGSASCTDDLISPEDALTGYLDRVFYPGRRDVSNRVTDRMTARQLSMYNYLRGEIAEVAAGTLTSTYFDISPSMLEFEVITAAELGMTRLTDSSGSLTSSARKAVEARVESETVQMVQALRSSSPYDLYWWGLDYRWYWNWEITSAKVTFTSFTLALNVAEAFRDGDEFLADPSIGTAASEASATARAIVGLYSSYSDVEKLRAYKNAVCDLTDYNHDAWADGQALVSYGNPWQLLWVFDGDPDTKVVCEGYSKAFHYLCELSSFRGSVSVASVYGNVDFGNGSGGGHMWNVVSFGNGKNLLVDCTNCDMGSSGHSDALFLAGHVGGDLSGGYYIRAYGGQYLYVYNTNLLNASREEDLALIAADGSDDPDPWELPSRISCAVGYASELVTDPTVSVNVSVADTNVAVYSNGYIYPLCPGSTMVTVTDASTSEVLGEISLIVRTRPADVTVEDTTAACSGYDFTVDTIENDLLRIRVFSFTPSVTARYYMFTYGSADTYGVLFDSSWTEIARNDDTSDTNFGITAQLTRDETYYILVRGYDPAMTFTSGFAIWYYMGINAETDTDYEAAVDTAGLNIFSLFIPTESGTYTFTAGGSLDTYGCVMNATFETVASDDDGGEGYNFCVEWTAEAGVPYVLGCRLHDSSLTGSFTWRVSRKLPTPLTEPDLVIPPGTLCIEEEAFEGTPARRVRLGEKVTAIMDRAFADCVSLEGIYIPSSCVYIAPDAFSGSAGVVIYCREDSFARSYAEGLNIPFVIVP